MIISRNLIAEYFPSIKNYSIEEINKAFLQSGIEIENLEVIPEVKGLFYGLIKSVEKIKGSDKLHLCKVDIPVIGNQFSIVCGASNVRKNLKVLVALPGAELNGGKLKIGRREIFGVVSEGMICSYSELYESKILTKSRDSNEGIIEFCDDWNELEEFDPKQLGLDDIVFDLSIPSNRTDLYCAWGIAQELSKIFDAENSVNSLEVIYFDEINLWDLKPLLLTNNCVCGDYEQNINTYLYLSFNEAVVLQDWFVIKNKSSYFLKLIHDYVRKIGLYSLDTYTFASESYSKPVNLDWERIKNFLCLSDKHIQKIIFKLSKFNFGFSPDNSVVFPPFWRIDLKTERDFCEELLRLWDVSEIKEQPVICAAALPDNRYFLGLEKIKEFFRNHAFMECTTFNLLEFQEGRTTIQNPISNSHVSIKRNSIKSLVEVLERNFRSKNKLFPVFEISNIFPEGFILSVVVSNFDSTFALNGTSVKLDLYDLKPLVKRALSYLNQDIYFSSSFSPDEDVFIERNLLNIFNSSGEIIGKSGFIKSELPYLVWGLWVRLSFSSPKTKKVPEVSEFPPSFRDISLEISNNSVGIGEVVNSLKGKWLREVEVVEQYKLENSISYLIRCKFQSYQKTLRREEIDADLVVIYNQLQKMSVLIR